MITLSNELYGLDFLLFPEFMKIVSYFLYDKIYFELIKLLCNFAVVYFFLNTKKNQPLQFSLEEYMMYFLLLFVHELLEIVEIFV